MLLFNVYINVLYIFNEFLFIYAYDKTLFLMSYEKEDKTKNRFPLNIFVITFQPIVCML